MPPGTLSLLAQVTTLSGARNAVATGTGEAYVTDSREGKILVVQPVGDVPPPTR